MATLLILGASRGLGEAFALGLPKAGDTTYVVSRSKPSYLSGDDGIVRHWIEADLSLSDSVGMIQSAIGDRAIDVCIYNAGTWEMGSFQETDDSLIKAIIDTNLTTALLITKRLLPNIAKSKLRKIVIIGSTAGVENSGCDSVAYTASKFGLRGVAHALREVCRPLRIGVTCINPGGIASKIGFEQGVEAALEAYKGNRIPVQDIVELVKCIMQLSLASCIKEIDMPALSDEGV